MKSLVSVLAAVAAIGLQAATTYTATEQYVQNVVKAESNRTDLAIGALRQEVQDAKYLTPSAIKAGANISVITNAAGEVTIAADGGVEVDFTTNNTVLVTTIETVAPATNIARSALAQNVQASLAKADSALQTTGGTMTGALNVSGAFSVIDQIAIQSRRSTYDAIVGIDDEGTVFVASPNPSGSPETGYYYNISFPTKDGYVALLSDIYTAIQQIAPDFTAKVYALNELCTYDGVVYRCKSAYTATSSSVKPNSDTTHWEAKKVSELFLPLTGGEMAGNLSIVGDHAKLLVQDTDSPRLNGFEIDAHERSFHLYRDGYPDNTLDLPSASGTIALTAGTGHDGNLAALDTDGNPVDSGLSKDNIRWVKGVGKDSAAQIQSSETPVVTGTNTVISQSSVVEGASNFAGLKGYRYTNTGDVTNSLTFETEPIGWAVDDVISVVNDSKYSDCVTIASISGATVTFTTDLPFSSIVADTGWDAKTAYVITKPNVGDVELGYGAYAAGLGTKALNTAAHAEGRDTDALGQYSHAEGRGTEAQYCAHAEGRGTAAKGEYSHAEGNGTTADGSRSHAEGSGTTASGYAAHAEGTSTKATAEYSHSEGFSTLAQGIRSHAEGNETKAFGAVGHSEGNNSVVGGDYTSNTLNPGSNTTSGAYSHAEGNAALVTGSSAHAEGLKTFASQLASHAEGARTSATGIGSHSEGVDSAATGRGSHAEGDYTKAEGAASHAEGSHTKTSNASEHAQGQYNKSNRTNATFPDAGNTIHSIGIGTSESNRKNAVEVMQGGKVFVMDIGGYIGTNPTGQANAAQDLATVMGNKADKSDIDPLLFAQYYPGGEVKSAAQFTSGIKYDAPDTTNRTITVKPFCDTRTAGADDNSRLVGRVVIPPFVDASGKGYISDDGTRYKVVGVSADIPGGDDNQNLTAVIAPNTMTNIGGYAFYYCDSLTSVSFPAATTIGNWAFGNCELTSVSFPAATTVGEYAFSGCTSLDSVSLPAATTIGESAFSGCSLRISVSLPAVTTVGNSAFRNCGSLTSISLPAATTIGNGAFFSSSLTSVSLPAATTIGGQAFYFCSSLDSVSLPSATSIGIEAFYDCIALTSVDFGDTPRQSVPTLGTDAFYEVPTSCKIIVPYMQFDEWTAADGWKNLPQEFVRHAETADKPATFAAGNLAEFDANGSPVDSGVAKSDVESLFFAQYYPDGNVKSAAQFTSGIKYDAPDTTNRTITVKPFCNTGAATNDNSSLVGRVVIPPFVDASGKGYISDDGTRYKVVGVSDGSDEDDNDSLTAVIAPNTVTNVGGYAFIYCTSLTSVSFPAVATIGSLAFNSGTSLTSVSLPAATTIEEYAFIGCTSLDSVSLPAATTIGNGAFMDCSSLDSVDFGDTPRQSVPTLGNDAFNSVPTTCKIIVPDAQYNAWVAAPGWSNLVTAGYKFLRHSEWGYIRKNPLTGNKYDFSTNADVQRAVKDIVEALGGSVTNFPAIP